MPMTAKEGNGEGARTLTMTEVLRLSDQEGVYTLVDPNGLTMISSGAFYIQGDEQLLFFDATGQYKGNIMKKGEGPGELKQVGGIDHDGDTLIIGSMMPVKLMRFDKDGTFRDEIKIDGLKPFANYILTHGAHHYFWDDDQDLRTSKAGLNKNLRFLMKADAQGKAVRTALSFETIDVVIKRTIDGRNMIMSNEVVPLLHAHDKSGLLYVSHGERYRISQIDLASHRIVKEIKRPYVPQAYKSTNPTNSIAQEMERSASQKWFCDLAALRCRGKELIVLTSEFDEKKGLLVDRFNPQGQLIETVYLPIPGVKRPEDLKGKLLFFDRDCFWTSSLDDEENPVVIKFQVDWKM
jgi:hypothetical protein